MSCKSALYAANLNNQTLSSGDTISFGSIVRRFGCNTNLSGGNVVVNGTGYYDIDTNFDFAPTAAGTVTIELYKNGTKIPGAEATWSVAADVNYHISIPAIIREACWCESVITAIITGADSVVTNAAITVEKI